MNKKDLLIEFGTEELPYKQAISVLNQIKHEINSLLAKENANFTNIETYYTINRISLIIRDIKKNNSYITIKKKGPPLQECLINDYPTEKLIKFVKKNNINIKTLKKEKTNKGSWIIYEKKIKEKKLKNIILDTINEIMLNLNLEKSMRWSIYKNEFIRPIKWITILLNNKVIKFKYNNIKSNNYTYGNKFIENKKIYTNITNYKKDLEEKGLVLIDYKKRKNKIQMDLRYTENIYNFHALINRFLLKEIINLTEFPYLIKGEFKNIYLKLPTEIIMLIIQKYCKAIPIKKNNKITNFFLTISNVQLNNYAKTWYNFSLNSKLSKILFIFKNDNINYNKNKLNKLKNIIFQEKLGSMYNKIKRLKKISSYILKKTKMKIKYKNLSKSVLYSKLDLTTILVSEIPELEGIIGSYYIKKNKNISIGIREQYKPKTIYDNIPKTDLGKILSLSDKIDTITGMLIINKLPTGNKDPYSIKRKIMSVIRIIIEANINLNIKKILIISLKFFSKKDFKLLNKMYLYLKKKLENFFKYKKYNTEIFFSLKNIKNIYTAYKKLSALSIFFSDEKNKVIIAITTRIKNIILQNLKKKTKINLNIIETNIEKNLIKIYYGIKIVNKELYKKKKI